MGRIDFFIAGVQKSGTTALDTFLRKHPRLQMARIKEPHFFDNEQLDWSAPDYSLLSDMFDWAEPSVRRGEATPIYTYWPNCLERLKVYNPAALIIVGLRHPTFRAYSQWRMEISRGADQLDFSTAIRAGRSRVREAPQGVHRVFSYVERGFYDRQVSRLLSLFPRNQIHFFRTDWLFSRSAETLREIEEFLAVPNSLDSETGYIVPLKSIETGAMLPQDRRHLNGLFATSITQTQALTGMNLSDWLDEDYQEPMIPH